MSRSRYLLLALVCASVAAIAGTLAGRAARTARHEQPAAPPPDTEQPSLSVDPRHLDFGEVWAEKNYNWPVRVTNGSALPVEILAVKGDCSCVAVGKLPPILRPGDSAELPLTLDLTLASPPPEEWIAAYNTKLTVTLREGSDLKDQLIEVRGRAKAALRPNPATLRVGLLSVRDHGSPRTMRVTPSPAVDRIEFVPDARWRGAATRTAPGGNDFDLTVTAAAPIVRTVADELRLRLLDVSGRELANVPLQLSGEIVPDVLPHPRELYFGSVTSGVRAEDELALRSLSERSFRVVGVQAPLGVSLRAIGRNGSAPQHRFAVTIESPAPGDVTFSLALEIEEADGASGTIVVPVAYSGTRSGTK